VLKKLRKSSSHVTLVLIGVAALSGCGGESKRDLYASREDCLADWGNKTEDCTPATESQHRSRGFYYGPTYGSSRSGSSWGSSSGSRSSSGSSSSSRSFSSSGSSSRGGFGSSGHSSSG
jgi:hypothetical protein